MSSVYDRMREVLPQWKGQKSTAGVAVAVGGGLGDFVLLFARFLKVAALDKGIPVVLVYDDGAPSKARAELIELMVRQSWCDPRLVRHGELDTMQPFLDVCDCCTDIHGLLDLFTVNGTLFIGDLPAPRWEVKPDFSYRENLGPNRPVVGLCWKAGTEYFPDPSRSLSPRLVERLVRSTPAVTWVNLNLDDLDLPGVLNPEHNSVSKLASVIAAADLILSVDSFPMHLSASLGKETLLLLSATPCGWYWSNGSRLYPTLEVIRDWRGLAGDVDHIIKRFNRPSAQPISQVPCR